MVMSVLAAAVPYIFAGMLICPVIGIFVAVNLSSNKTKRLRASLPKEVREDIERNEDDLLRKFEI